MIDGLFCLHHLCCTKDRLSRVEIAVESGKVATRKIDPNCVSGFEDIARGPEVNCVFVDFTGHNFFGLIRRVAIAGPYNAICQETCVSTSVNVYEQRRKIRVLCGTRSIQLDCDETRHLRIFLKRGGGKDQHIGSPFIWALIEWSGRKRQPATESPSDGRHGMFWVVIVSLCALACWGTGIQETITFDAVCSRVE